MQVQVVRVPRPNVEQPVTVDAGARVADVLRALKIPPDAVIVMRDDAPLPLDAPVEDGTRYRVITVFSGG